MRPLFVLLKYRLTGREGRTFFLNVAQHALLLGVIFLTASVFLNYDSTFQQVSKILSISSGATITDPGGSIQVTAIPKDFNWTSFAVSQSSASLISYVDQVMIVVGYIAVGGFICRELWSAFNHTRLASEEMHDLNFLSYVFGAKKRTIESAMVLCEALNALVGYFGGLALALFLLRPIVLYALRSEFLLFLVDEVPSMAFPITLIPALGVFVVSTIAAHFKQLNFGQ